MTLFTFSKIYHDENGDIIKDERFDDKKTWQYSYIYQNDKQNNSVTKYLENKYVKEFEEQMIYNDKQELFQRINNFRDNDAFGRRVPSIEKKEITEFSYNADGTLFSATIKLNGEVVQIRKHYYGNQ